MNIVELLKMTDNVITKVSLYKGNGSSFGNYFDSASRNEACCIYGSILVKRFYIDGSEIRVSIK